MRTFMKKTTTIVAAVSIVLAIGLFTGCSGGGEAKAHVGGAITLIEGSRPLLEDLLELDGRFNTLGTRFAAVEDTITEGKSLVEMAFLDVNELESRYTQARELLLEVTTMEGAGDYATYADLALLAVDKELEAISANRELLTMVSDMLDVLPLAQSQEQLSYYVEEIESLTSQVSVLLEEAAEAAVIADEYHLEHEL
jgi:hypothetical protein